MDQPLGAAVGNALEVREAAETTSAEGPPDFTELVLEASARLLALSDLGIDVVEGRARAEHAIDRRLGARDVRALDPRAGGRSRPRTSSRARPSFARSSLRARDVVTRRSALSRRDRGARARRRTPHEGRSRRPCGRRRVLCEARPDRSRRARSSPTCTRATTTAAAAAGACSPRTRSATSPAPHGILLDVVARRAAAAAPHGDPASDDVARAGPSARTCARAPRGRDDPGAARAAPRGPALARVEILDPRLTRPYDLFEVAEELEGDVVVAVERRGKYLLLRMESGLALLVHLRMTGSFGFAPVTHERAVRRARRRLAARLPRRTAVRDVARPRGRRARALPRDEERARAARAAASPRRGSSRSSRVDALRSRLCSSTSASSRASGTSTPTRRSGARASAPCARRTGSRTTRYVRVTRAIRAALRAGIERQGSTLRTTARPTARPARCRTSSASTAATASRARAAGRRSRRRASAAAAPGTARAASPV